MVDNRRLKRILGFAILSLSLIISACAQGEATPDPTQAASGGQSFIAGNFWSDVDAVERGKPLRLWMAFYAVGNGQGIQEELLTGDMKFTELRDGFLDLYANQVTQLAPNTVVEDSELELYLVDSQFQLALPLSEFSGTLKELWIMATGDITSNGGDRTSVDRTFVKRENPLGVTKLSMVAYVRRIAAVLNAKVSGNDIKDQAETMLANLAHVGEPLTGFIILVAPKDSTTPPYELEIRTPINTEQASKKKPVGHTAQKLSTIDASSAQITQMRIKSGEFLDLRIYNSNTQLSFKQATGVCEAGTCLDLAVYGTPTSLKDLQMGISPYAHEELLRLGIDELHIRICTPGGVKPYVEYWVAVPLT